MRLRFSLGAWGKKLLPSLSIFAMLRKSLPDGSKNGLFIKAGMHIWTIQIYISLILYRRKCSLFVLPMVLRIIRKRCITRGFV